MPLVCRIMPPVCRPMPLVVPNNAACVPTNAACVPTNAACVPSNAACCAEQRRLCAEQRRLCAEQRRLCAEPCRLCAEQRRLCAEQCRWCAESLCAKAEVTRPTPPRPVRSPRGSLSTAAPPPPKWEPRLRRREGKRPNGAPLHHNAHTPNAERKRYLHNSRTKTQRRTKRCAQFVIFIFTLCKLLHNFSTVLHRSPRNLPKRAQIAARRPDLPCFTFPSRAGSPKIVMKNRPASRLRHIASAGRDNTP